MHEKHIVLKAWVYGFASAVLTGFVLALLLAGCEVCTETASGPNSCDPVADAGRDGGADGR